MEQLLAKVEPFSRLTPEQRRRLAPSCREKHYAKGETIFRAGQPADAVCFVKEGRVHLMRFLESGQASTTCVMTKHETFCCLPALDRKPYPVDAVAAEDSVVVRVPIETFHALLQSDPKFLQESLGLFCDRLRQVEDKSCSIYVSVERRLTQTLVALSKKFGKTIPLTKHELAEMANTTVDSAIRALSELKRQGIVTSSRGSTTIVKPAELLRLAGS
jgi:CRP-like cAMP-binding protein